MGCKEISLNFPHRRKLASAGVLLLANSTLVSAQTNTLHSLQDSSEDSGWGGYVQLLIGNVTANGLSEAIDGNEVIFSRTADSTRQEPEFFTTLWQVKYHNAQNRTTVSLGTPEQGVIDNRVSIQASINREFSDGSALWVAYEPPISAYSSEIWSDPYRTGQRRTMTQSSVEAIHVGFDYLFGGPLSMQIDASELNIDDDRAGESLNGQISSVDINRLQRAGKFLQAYLSFSLPLTDRLILIPGLHYSRTDSDGDATSYSGSSANLTAVYQQGSLEFFIDGSNSKARFDEPNPVFNIRRDDNNYGFTVGASYVEPFGLSNIRIEGYANESRRNSNIPFYDSRNGLLAIAVTYLF